VNRHHGIEEECEVDRFASIASLKAFAVAIE